MSWLKYHYHMAWPKLLIESEGKGDRGSFMSAHVLLNLLNELRKSDKMRDLPSIFISFSQQVK